MHYRYSENDVGVYRFSILFISPSKEMNFDPATKTSQALATRLYVSSFDTSTFWLEQREEYFG